MDEIMAGVHSPNHEVEMLDESDFMIVEDESHVEEISAPQDVEMDDHKSDVEDEEMIVPHEHEEEVEVEVVDMIDHPFEEQEELESKDRDDTAVNLADESQGRTATQDDSDVIQIADEQLVHETVHGRADGSDEVVEEFRQSEITKTLVSSGETPEHVQDLNDENNEEESETHSTSEKSGLENLNGHTDIAETDLGNGEAPATDELPVDLGRDSESHVPDPEAVTVGVDSGDESDSVSGFFDSAEAKEQAELFNRIPIMIHLEDGNDVYYMYQCDMLDSSASNALIVDDTALHLNLEETFGILRTSFESIGEAFSMDEELTFEFPQLGLQIGEDNCYSKELGIFDVLLMFSDISRNTAESERPDTLEIVLGRQPRFISTFNYLSELVRDGKGFEALIATPGGESEAKEALHENEKQEASTELEATEEFHGDNLETIEIVDSPQAENDHAREAELALSEAEDEADIYEVTSVETKHPDSTNGAPREKGVGTAVEPQTKLEGFPDSARKIQSSEILPEKVSSTEPSEGDPYVPDLNKADDELTRQDNKADDAPEVDLDPETPPKQDENFLEVSPIKIRTEQQTHYLSEVNTPKNEEEVLESRKRPLDPDLESEEDELQLKRVRSAESLEV